MTSWSLAVACLCLFAPQWVRAATVASDTSALLSICDANPSAAVCTTGSYIRTCRSTTGSYSPNCSAVVNRGVEYANTDTFDYEDTTGAAWKDGTDPCSAKWAGVTCDDAKERVTALELKSNGISELPVNVTNLTALKVLILVNNSLTELPEPTKLVTLSHLVVSRNRLTTLPGGIGDMKALESLSCDKNDLAALPDSIGSLSNLKSADLSGNRITTLPNSIGSLANLETLSLRGNFLESLPASFASLTSLKKLWLDGNRFPEDYGYPSPGMCSGGFFADLDDGIDMCFMCPEKGSAMSRLNLGVYLIMLAAAVSLYIVWAISSAHWRPEPREVACVVYFGRRAVAHDAALAWRQLLVQRFDAAHGGVHLDHDETSVEPGDEVLIADMDPGCAGRNNKLDGQKGTVTVPPVERKDQTIARVSFPGTAGIKNIPVGNLTVQPFVNEDPAAAPAICICVSMEWLTSDTFMTDVLNILAQRCGVSDVNESATLSNFQGQAQGVIFALCGDENFSQHPVIRKVSTDLNLKSEQILRSDASGGDIVALSSNVPDGEQNEAEPKVRTHYSADLESGLRSLEDFCENHRKSEEHAEATDKLRDAVVLRTQELSKVTRIANNVKTIVAQLQQSFTLLGIDMNWPTLVENVRRWVGTVVLLDVSKIVPLECVLGDKSGAGGFGKDLVYAVIYVMLGLLFTICFMYGYIAHAKSKWSKKEDAAAAETAAHLNNCGWALFTFLAPMVLGKTLWMSTSEQAVEQVGPSMRVLGIVFTIALCLVPGLGLYQMWDAREKGILTSRSFEARCGWLCSRYKPEFFWFELVFLETRYVTMAVATLAAEYPIGVASVYIAMTMLMLGLQIKLMPFRESEAEAKHWSSSNKTGGLGHLCSLLVAVAGLTLEMEAKMSSGARTSLTVLIMLAIIVPAVVALLTCFVDVQEPTDMSTEAFGLTVSDTAGDSDEKMEGEEEEQFSNPLAVKPAASTVEAELDAEPALVLFESTLEIQQKLILVVAKTVTSMGWKVLFEKRSLRSQLAVLDFDSFRTVCRDDCDMSRETMNDAQIKALFNQVDTDRSGDVTLDEFLEFMFTEHTKSTPKRLQGLLRAAMERLETALGWQAVFDSFDTDGSGGLSKQEFIQAIRSNCGAEMAERNVWISDDELSELFYAADVDGSGEIEYDEFVELVMYQAPAGDEAAGDEV